MILRLILIFSFCLSLANNTFAQAIEGKLLDTWSVDTIVPTAQYDNIYNEIWGLVVNGREYAVIGSTYGTHFIDVTNPSDIVEVAVIKGNDSSDKLVHRDYHDYKGYLYAVAQEGNSTMQIIDYSDLPNSVSVLYDSSDILGTAHNIFIDTSSAIMYAGVANGDNVNYAPMRLFDLSEPLNPKVIADYNTVDGYFLNHMHDAYVVNDTAFINCGPRGLLISDFSDPKFPINITSLDPLEYPQSGYNHSGWLSDDHQTYIMADETWGTDLKVWDITQLPDMILIDTIDAGATSELSIAHNQIIHGDYLYSSYYYDGLQVWDIKDPYNIERVLYYKTSERDYARTYEGAWGVYPFLPSGNILVSDMQEGLFVIEGVDRTLSGTQIDPIENDWQVFPNPVSNTIDIKTELDLNNYKVELFDAVGNRIKNLKGSTPFKINLPNGIYHLRLSSKNISSTKSVIVAQ